MHVCDPGYTALGVRSCIKIVNKPDTWLGALMYCVREGANLVSVSNRKEQTQLMKLAPRGAWLGLSDILHERRFAWIDKNPLTFINWRRGQPNNAGGQQDCVWQRPDSLWDDVRCSGKKAFGCQKKMIN